MKIERSDSESLYLPRNELLELSAPWIVEGKITAKNGDCLFIPFSSDLPQELLKNLRDDIDEPEEALIYKELLIPIRKARKIIYLILFPDSNRQAIESGFRIRPESIPPVEEVVADLPRNESLIAATDYLLLPREQNYSTHYLSPLSPESPSLKQVRYQANVIKKGTPLRLATTEKKAVFALTVWDGADRLVEGSNSLSVFIAPDRFDV